jgi:hypothetical protein
VTGDPSSRAATNELLAGLRLEQWRPRAWGRFLARAAQRSAQQAALHPRALAEVTVLHAAFAVIGPRRRHAWTLTSWALAAAHLGMLEQHRSIGWPNAITLARANLPTFIDHRWTAVLAVGTDLADGRLARKLGAETTFGAAADSLADAAFWAWYARRHEPRGSLRAAALLAWVVPVVTVTTASLKRGRMVDAPRPAVVRPAAALQAILAARAIMYGAKPSTAEPSPCLPRCCAAGPCD